ncbi:TIGR03086 family metal-binding protein [Mycobacterium vicinigordonae]|uniref:TIGR03086 family protein n=1 Tax=Mycobacterium vicinigordonae TaxID=1719132 RepID=A0A7D6HNA3_9MYCO|nr:TIGR03086 family metal-binding protein [Mycobacterium vicinigordonae]QLL06431.1 TIGR03086 family protein [Mycobacterium vicinigordonae]
MTDSALDALETARSQLTPRLKAINMAQWNNTTTCPEWNLRQLVNHVVGLHHRIARILRGGSREQFIATREDDWLGTDHIAAWQRGTNALDDAIGSLADLNTVVAYRVPLPARDAVGLVAFDTAIHIWDISRAIGFDERLDDALVEFALDFIEWVLNEPRLSFFTPPVGPPPSGAAPQGRLLYLAGREP